MELKLINATVPEGANIIIGQAHFIKTVEDLYEIIKTSAPEAKFGTGSKCSGLGLPSPFVMMRTASSWLKASL